MSLFTVQSWILVLLGAAAFAMQAWALFDAATARAEAFVAAGKRTKGFWLLVTGVAAAIGFVSIFRPLNIFNLVAVVGAALYLTDVRPAVRAVQGRGRSGPYGPW